MVAVEVKWIDGMRFWAMPDSGHPVVMDNSREEGGKDSAPRPMELVLVALAGCTGMDVVALLKKMRVKFQRLEIRVQGKRREKHPRVYRRVEVLYTLYGHAIPEEKVKRAIELSQEKYCSVSAILRESAEVTYRYQIVPA